MFKFLTGPNIRRTHSCCVSRDSLPKMTSLQMLLL